MAACVVNVLGGWTNFLVIVDIIIITAYCLHGADLGPHAIRFYLVTPSSPPLSPVVDHTVESLIEFLVRVD